MNTSPLSVAEDLGLVGGVLLERINRPLRIILLDDTDGRVRDEDEQNNQGLYERAPPAGALRVLKECEDERDDSGCQEDQDELVLELFEDELP